jgi:hypothetical protein
MKQMITKTMITLAIFAVGASALAVPIRPAESRYIVKPGPNWTFVAGKKSTIELPKKDKIIFGSRMDKFEAWKSTHKNLLLLFPGYQEPMIAPSEDPNATPIKKELEVFDARFAFIIERPISKFTAQSMLDLEFIKSMDTNFDQRTIPVNSITATGDPETDKIKWCSAPNSLCLESTFTLSILPAKVLAGYYSSTGRKSPAPKDIQLQSEINFIDNATEYSMYDSEARAVNQKTFYINHFFQYAVTNIIFNKIDDTHTLVVGMTAIGVQEDVLNMGSDVLASMGLKSTTRDFIYAGTGFPGLSGVENGLVPYAQEMAANLKTALENFK